MILYIDACPRKESRTRELAETLLKNLSGNIDIIQLSNVRFFEMDDNGVKFRTNACKKGDFRSPVFDLAKQFANADTIVIAAPYWDLSFPAILKKYIESICVTGITFRYTEQGYPESMCKAKKAFYVTTSGGPIINREFGSGYIESVCKTFFGINDFTIIEAENLDIYGNDAKAIIEETKLKINRLI